MNDKEIFIVVPGPDRTELPDQIVWGPDLSDGNDRTKRPDRRPPVEKKQHWYSWKEEDTALINALFVGAGQLLELFVNIFMGGLKLYYDAKDEEKRKTQENEYRYY